MSTWKQKSNFRIFVWVLETGKCKGNNNSENILYEYLKQEGLKVSPLRNYFVWVL